MANTKITPVKGEINKLTKIATVAASTEGMEFKLPRTSDEYVVVLAQNTDTANAHSFTVKAPTKGSYCASDSDETISLAAGETAIFRFESARFANNDGTVVCLADNAKIAVAVIY